MSFNKDQKYLIILTSFTAFGPLRTKLLIDYFGDPKSVVNATSQSLLQTGLSKRLVDGFIHHRKVFNFDKYIATIKKLKI